MPGGTIDDGMAIGAEARRGHLSAPKGEALELRMDRWGHALMNERAQSGAGQERRHAHDQGRALETPATWQRSEPSRSTLLTPEGLQREDGVARGLEPLDRVLLQAVAHELIHGGGDIA